MQDKGKKNYGFFGYKPIYDYASVKYFKAIKEYSVNFISYLLTILCIPLDME